jgi:SAM-dependent methyltransferase
MSRRSKVYYAYNEQSKGFSSNDFWRQVKHTINGQAISQQQIDMIADSIVRGLQPGPRDVVLDLCCGNGALSDMIFGRCAGGVGVDFAEYLIAIARENFQRPNCTYLVDDIADYVAKETDTARFTRVLCYSGFQYFALETATAMLRSIRQRFPNVTRLFLGSLPDRSRLHKFYSEDTYLPGIEDDHEAPLGTWRTESQLAELAAAYGWDSCFENMPSEFHAAHYRYDAILTPR